MAGEEATVFEDRTVSPTYVVDAARATRQLVEHDAPIGLYHCVNDGYCTWLEFARELARQAGVEPRLLPVRMADVRLRAERPLYCALSNQKLVSAGVMMPGWQDALRRCLAG
jgi:dTDP-4-dehydrorhamnose reductase